MSDIGPIKPLAHTNPIRPLNKDTAKKEQQKKKKDKVLPELEKDDSEEHVNEYI